MWYGEYSPYVRGLGVFPHMLGFGGHWDHWVSICFILYLLVVHYVSCTYHSYEASCNIGSVRRGSATTPDTKSLWRCYWLCLCATAANSIFDASSGLCQLCYGFSTGRFLFQSWASHHFVYYMFGVHSGVCFLLSCAKLDAIFTYGGSTIRVCTIATPWSLPMAGICVTWWWSLVNARYA